MTIREKSENDMARVAAIKTSKLMRASLVEETHGGPHSHTVPGLVVIIEHRDGSVQTIAPMPAPPIEVEPIRERAELEPPGR